MKQFDVVRFLLRFSVLMTSALLAFCAPAAPFKIMPLGDSITMGYGVGGGFRTKLFSNLVNNGYSFLFVGSNPENPSPALTAADQHFHEGHGGFKINEISANLVGGGNWLAVDPDLVLLLIGTNDYGQDYDTPNALNRLDELLTTIATNRPNAVVIVANILLRTDAPSVDSKIQSEFNANLPSRIAAHAALGRRIFFYDLRSWIDAFDLLDGLHPSKNGYNKLGDGWFTAINQIYNLDTNGPTLVKAESGIRLTNVTVTFNEPVSDNSAVPGNFALSGGASVFNAKLNTNGNREMLLRTSVLAPGSNYVVTVNNVTDRSTNHNVIKPNSSTNFVTPVPVSGVFSNIAEAANLTLLYSLDLPASANFNSTGVTYAVNQSASLANGFTRVAYYLELQKPNGQLDYVYVSMDPFTTLAGRLGVPTTASGAFFQQSVSNLHVFSTLSDVVTGTNLSGRLEFWPSSYGPQNSAGVPGASSSLYDWGDGGASTSAGHGSMQILNPAASQVLIAYNGWGSGATSDVGLGNRPTGDPDWTFAANASQYALKRLQVLVQPALASVVHVPFNENTGTTTTNRGSAGGVFTLTTPLPSWTTEVPPDAGGASALDFGLSSGNVAVDSPAPIAALGGLGAFTITGWLNNRSIVQGSGGNVIATWFDGTTSGVEVVYKSDGSLIFSVNDVPSSSAPRSSAGKIPEEFEINPANWRYFAVTYDSAMGKGAFYFGSPAQDATLDVIRDYPGQGPTAPVTARFSVGSLNPERRPFSQNRVFRGFIDDVRVFKQVLTLPEIISVQHGAAGTGPAEPTNITRHLTITSTNPVTGALINVSPADTNSASSGPTPLDRYYADNTVVTLTAPAMAGGNLFSKWQRDGTDLTTNLVAMVTMDADHTLLAVFVTPPPPRTITVSSTNPASGVLVTVTPADNSMQTDGTTTFTRVFSNTVSVTFTAPATAGVNSFQKWQRDGVDFSTNRILTITVDADRTFTAIYVSPPPPRTITIASVNPTNGVLVGVSPPDVNMQGDGTTTFTRAFNNNVSVTLAAPAITGVNGFQKWQRDGTDFSTNRIIAFAVDANRAFTAIYTSPPPPRVLTVASVNPTNGVLVGVSPADVNLQGDGTTAFTRAFSNGVSVTFTAPAITGVNGFQKWQRDGTDFSTNRIITFAVDVDRAFTAIYTSPPPPRVLTVASVNPTNGVLVGVSPLDVNMQGDGTTAFTRAFSNGVSVTFTAPAITGTNGFQKWQRDGTDFSTNRIITFAVDVDRAFTAIYTSPPPPRVLTVASVNPTSGVAIAVVPADNMSLAGGVTTFLRTYSNGVSVTLTAPAGVGSNTFTKWQRDGVDFTTNLSAVVTMDAARTLTAVYASPPPPLFPLVRLAFDEASGTNTANLGSAGGAFGLTQNSPVRTQVVPPGVGGSNALDFGTSSGSYAVDSAAPLPALAGLTKFTLTGWLNNRSVVQGSGGNRVLSCIDNGGDGFEVVYKGDGSLILSVNQNPDSASARSSSGRIPEDYFASAANWRFFAITYDSGTGNVEFFFGSGTADATSDGTRSYPDRGPVGAGTGRLTIGHMNPATRSAYLSRVFRGVIDDVQIFDRILPPSDIVLVQRTAPSAVPPTPPGAAFTGTPLTGLAPLNVSFTDSSTGTITNRTWDFGDGSGTNVAGTSVGHVFAAAGNYTVMLRVIGPGGTNTLTRTSYVTVTNPQPPAAAFTASPTSGGRPLPVTFTDTSTGTITNRVWDFGDGTGTNTSATSVPHTYAAAGSYSVMLTAQGPGGASIATQNNLITVTNPPVPVAKFTASPTSGGRPLPVTFTDTSSGSITNRVWDFGDGTGTNTSATSVPHTYAVAGVYSVMLTAQGPGGANTITQNNWITVTNPPAPMANFSASPNIGSRPLPVTFTDTSTGSITNRAWDFGDGTGTNTLATNVTHTYTAAGSYTVGLTVQGPGGTHSLILSPTVLVTNPPPPVANFTGSPLQGATPLTVTFLDSSTGGITNRQWTFGDSTGTNTTVTNCAHVYFATGTFTVTLTVNGPGGNDTQVRAGYVTVTNSSGIMPVVKLPLNEGAGLATANLGSAGGVFSLTPNTPTWTAGGAPGVGGASAIDFSFYSGDFAVDSPAIIPALAGLTQFTITGWLNNRSNIQGSGGNRVVTWATAAGDGVDLVYRSDGSLDLGVNRLADGTARSSSGRIPVDANAGAANWRFFAVTYDAGAQQVRYYFGAAGNSAVLDVLKSYAQGPVSASIGRMTVGHSGPTVRPTMLNRVFRGLIDEIQIFDRALTLTQITALQGGSPPPPSPAPRFIPTLRPRIVGTEWQDGAMALRVSGTAGRHYAVLAGDDFLNWTAVGEADADETGAFQFIDAKASEFRVRFYQVVEPY